MIEKLKLYYGVDIVVNNTRILKNRYTGKFRTKDGVEHVLKVLKLNNKFTYTKNDETNVITINKHIKKNMPMKYHTWSKKEMG